MMCKKDSILPKTSGLVMFSTPVEEKMHVLALNAHIFLFPSRCIK
jgi:hypothetical protein